MHDGWGQAVTTGCTEPAPLHPRTCVCVSQVVSDVIVVKAAAMRGEAVAAVRMTGLGYALQSV